MSNAKDGTPKIVYRPSEEHEGFEIGRTYAKVTINDRDMGGEYDYPRITGDHLSEAARTYLKSFGVSDEYIDARLEFAYRNGFAGLYASKVRSRCTMPKTKSIKSRLQELVCDMIGQSKVEEGIELQGCIAACRTEDDWQVLWAEHLKVGNVAEPVRPDQNSRPDLAGKTVQMIDGKPVVVESDDDTKE